eukprot:TRINITY_DN6327_c0_g1_i1.p1 TRINITY_DN6327_c0_g1~~TRINITY_DN6327_c0_g1_i1.p1  ORF type:complete len:517 (+),score=116.15 TRINITY_DN6327_c0_g1_i1:99-1649(+)
MRHEDRFSLKLVLNIVFEDEYKLKWWKNVRSTSKIWKEIADSAFPYEDSRILGDSIKNGTSSFFRYILERSKPCPNDSYALSEALIKKEFEMAELLLQEGRGEVDCFHNLPIKKAVQYSQLKLVQILLKDPKVDPSATICPAVRDWVCGVGSFEIVKLLLEDPRVERFDALEWILTYAPSQTEAFRKLLSLDRMDPSMRENRALTMAVSCPEIMEVLLLDPRVDPSVNDNEIICSSVHHKIVQMLIKDHRVDPTARDNLPIRLAFKSSYEPYRRIKILLSDKRVDPSAQNHEVWNSLTKWERHMNSKDELKCYNLLLKDPRVDPSANNNFLFRRVVSFWPFNYKLCVMLLKDKRVDPGDRDNEALIELISSDKVDRHTHKEKVKLVKILLKHPKVDPSARNNAALVQSTEYKPWWEVIKLLIRDPRVNPSVNHNRALINCAKERKLNLQVFCEILQHPRIDLSEGADVILDKLWKGKKERAKLKAIRIMMSDKRVVDSLDQTTREDIQRNLDSLEK